jgi:hypothetical protein
MNKNNIKQKLRESLFGLFEDEDSEKKTNNVDNQDDPGEDKSSSDVPLDQRDQTSIQNALDKQKNPLAPSLSRVMQQVTGNNPSDSSARSAFRKKIKQEDGLGLTDKEKDKTEVALGLK